MSMPEDLKSLLITVGLRLLAVAVVFMVGRWLIGYGQRWLHKALERIKLQPSMETLLERSFYFAAWLLVVLTILAVLGVPVTVLVAVTGLAIIVVGIALKESLADIAAAVIFMMFQPFGVGEVIQTKHPIRSATSISLRPTQRHRRRTELMSTRRLEIAI